MTGYRVFAEQRYAMFIQRLENYTMDMKFTKLRKRALIVLTSGMYNKDTCRIQNAFQKREFSGMMKNDRKQTENNRKLAWFTTDCVVAKLSQFAYDYVCFNLIGEKLEISKCAEGLTRLWTKALVIQVREQLPVVTFNQMI